MNLVHNSGGISGHFEKLCGWKTPIIHNGALSKLFKKFSRPQVGKASLESNALQPCTATTIFLLLLLALRWMCCLMNQCCYSFLLAGWTDSYSTFLAVRRHVMLLPWACCSLQVFQRRGAIVQHMSRNSLKAALVFWDTLPDRLKLSCEEESVYNIFRVYVQTPECLQPELIGRPE